MKSQTEEFCKSRFTQFLAQFFAPLAIAWEDVAQRDEPPDYYLYLDNTKFAVEVTTLMEKIEVGATALPEAAIINSLWQFVDEVEMVAKSKKCLQGTYVVSFSQSIDDFGNVKDEIRDDLLKYIRATRDVDSAPQEIVFKRGRQQCGIQKLHNKSDKIAKAGPTRFKWEGEAAIDICDLLEERLSDKDRKLSDIACPKILLLYDSYRFADLQMYKDCISQFSALAAFHTVFVVQGNGNSFTLYSDNPDWAN